MTDYAVVLNAGSSSLKFCVYQRPDAGAWRLEARGLIEGIGTSPWLSAKDETGASLDDRALDASVRDGRAALDALAAWLQSRYGGARVVGVGHRVVHGGATYAGPVVVTPQVLEDLRALVPLAPPARLSASPRRPCDQCGKRAWTSHPSWWGRTVHRPRTSRG